jgi:hypothetical protein
MTFSKRPSHARRWPWLLLGILCSFLLMAASSPQCARTDDLAFTPRFSPADDDFPGVGSCWQECAHAANEARLAEIESFSADVQACEDSECRAERAAQHVAIMQAISEAQRECMSLCHNQGAGTGGN